MELLVLEEIALTSERKLKMNAIILHSPCMDRCRARRSTIRLKTAAFRGPI